ncbi:ABC transporter ATP-binding protein [Pseudovibrio exalbescens]|uniref:energy-coupling factor ABC transporter ATP-binding protein n=1 Tax=Pseudovibrio exalbescens TaxID=197461 RepID=UPI002365CE19|nr:ABC transporter ATP-binding protein [Pseudovibrio exalbescens]MDD7911015.1 ABC transporter ATP-binding protein [Pseudovibrio exalbescens]
MALLFDLKDLRFAYSGRAPVLNGTSLTLAPGERLALIGANGAGKSTLLRLLVGLHHPQGGTITAFGRERREEADFHEVRCKAGYMFQDPDDQLFCPTVLEDIAFGPLNLGASKAEAVAIAEEILSNLHLSHLRDAITYKLSGGEKRLVALASVLAMKPEVLLLDEPTNDLDEANEARLLEILLGLPQAMIVISHNAGFRDQLATRRLHLKDGILKEA